MADATLSTKFSRRAMLAGASVVALGAGPGISARRGSPTSPGAPSPTPPPRAGEGLAPAVPAAPTLLSPSPPAVPLDAPADARLAVLAAAYRRVQAARAACMAEAEAQDDMFAWFGEPYKSRLDALADREDRLITELALIRPDSILGLAIKLRNAVFCEEDGRRALTCDERLLFPAMDDLEQMAEAALVGEP